MGFKLTSGDQSHEVDTSLTRTVHGMSGVHAPDVGVQGVPGEWLAGPVAALLEDRGWGTVVEDEFRPAPGVEIEDFDRSIGSQALRSGVLGAIGLETIMSGLGTVMIPERE